MPWRGVAGAVALMLAVAGGWAAAGEAPPLEPTPVVPLQPIAAPTQVVLQAPLALTHAHYAWTQTAGAAVALPADAGATARIDLPPPGSYAWAVSGGDGRIATPPVAVRLVVLADAAAGRWAIPYPERMQLKPGDRFMVDLRGVTVSELPPAEAAAMLPGPEVASAVASEPAGLAAVDWSRRWTVIWDGIDSAGGAVGDAGAEAAAAAAAERLQRWAVAEPLGPRLKLFQLPADLPAGVYTLRFRLLIAAGQPEERELHAGSIRLEAAPAVGAADVAAAGAAPTQIVSQPVTPELAAAQVGPGAPVIALPYGERTVTVRRGEALELDGRLCSDPDQDPLTYRWWQTRAPWRQAGQDRGPVGTTQFAVLDHPALWRWQPEREADIGLHEFVLSVSDGRHLVYSRPVKVKVEPAAATAAAELRVQAGPQLVVEVGRETRLAVTVEQFENGGWLPRYTGVEPRWAQKTRPPGVLRVDPNDALSAFQPYFRADRPGLYELEFSVVAGENISNTATVRVQVVAANRPPVWLFAETPSVSGGVGEALTVELPARDPDGDALQFQLRRLDGPWRPAGLTGAAVQAETAVADGVATVRLQLPGLPAGMYTIGAAVSDGHAFSATREVLAWVREPAAFGPFAIRGSSEAQAGQTAEFELIGAGAGGCFIRWQIGGANSRWQGAREGSRVVVLFDQAGTVELRAEVADGLGRATPVTLAVQVRSASARP